MPYARNVRVAKSLNDLPDDVIEQILPRISPEVNIFSLQRLSWRFNRLANGPLLWRFYCRTSFRFWHSRHEFHAKLRRSVDQVNWKQVYLVRKRESHELERVFEGIIATGVRRFKRFETVVRLGHDATDYLLAQSQVDARAEDYLARRYWSRALLDGINRSLAVAEWRRLQTTAPRINSGNSVHIEKALCAFNLFLSREPFSDLDEISRTFDEQAKEFCASCPGFEKITDRQKALALARWLHTNRLMVTKARGTFWSHALIHRAFHFASQLSLPLLYNLIFCCLAARLGLSARCCNFPDNVFIFIILPTHQADRELDTTDKPDAQQRMYMDIFQSSEEINLINVMAAMTQQGRRSMVAAWLEPASVASLIVRMAVALEISTGENELLHNHNLESVVPVCYSSLWAYLVLVRDNDPKWLRRWRKLLHKFGEKRPEDAWLIDQYLSPIFQSLLARLPPHQALQYDYWGPLSLRSGQEDLTQPRLAKGDHPVGNAEIPFKIGQVFKYSRYPDFIGVVVGWYLDTLSFSLTATTYRGDLPPEMHLEQTSQSADCLFLCYKIARGEWEPYRIQPANMELITDPQQVDVENFDFAGRFFKRFDPRTCTFISNIREQYPDD